MKQAIRRANGMLASIIRRVQRRGKINGIIIMQGLAETTFLLKKG